MGSPAWTTRRVSERCRPPICFVSFGDPPSAQFALPRGDPPRHLAILALVVGSRNAPAQLTFRGSKRRAGQGPSGIAKHG